MAIFTIAPVNSLSFVRINSLLENFNNTLHHELTGVLNKEPYHQKVVTGESIAIQIKSDYDTITAQVYNILTNTYTSLTVSLVQAFTTFSFYEFNFTVASAGYYKVFITGIKTGYSSVNLVSELIEAKSSWEGVKIEYYNSTNTGYVYYVTGLNHLLRVGGTVRFSDVGGKDEFYNNLGIEERIYSENETIDELTIEGIPFYLAKKIIYGSRLDVFKVNDLEYIVKEHSVAQHNGSHSVDLTLKLTQKDVYGVNEDFEPTELLTTIKYGFLYNRYAATDARNIAASGWNVPTLADCQTLQTYLGGESVAGGKLKETGFTYWHNPNIGATNEVGLNVRGAGYRDSQTGDYKNLMIQSFSWNTNTTTEFNGGYWGVLSNTASLIIANTLRGHGFPIRLVRSATVAEQLLADGTACDDYIGNNGQHYKTVKIGTQVWTAENLIETLYNDLTPIPEVTDNSAWAALTTGARCSYENDESNAFGEVEIPEGGSTTADSTTTTSDSAIIIADGS